MGQLWAALKGLGAIASLLSELLKWLQELRKEKKNNEADAQHAANEQAIEDAFGAGASPDSPAPVSPSVLDSAGTSEPRPETPKPS